MKNKNLLLIAPHGDDEINLLGTTAEYFKTNRFDLRLLLVTNGDYYCKLTETRYHETITVAKRMGFSKVHFLGYGDNPAIDETHIFHIKSFESYTSPAGHQFTYGVCGEQDYAVASYGDHHSYCKGNVKADIKACVLEERADVVICVDFDEHADHRMTSILFDEIIREMIIETDYRPIILKKYAYAGVWFGKDDYYCNPMRETILTPKEYFPYSAKQEIRVAVPRKYYPRFIKHSEIYRLCALYKSQNAVEHIKNIVNADALYFYRDSNNLAPKADIDVSSGDGSYLNDCKLIDTVRINAPKEEIISGYRVYTWVPDFSDKKRKIVFNFKKPIEVHEIHFSYPYQEEYRPKSVIIKINHAEKIINTGQDIHDVISFDTLYENVKSFSVQILNGMPGKCGISEIEIFSHHSLFPWSETPLKPFNPKSIVRYRPGSRTAERIDKILYSVKMFLRYDIKGRSVSYYLKKLLRKIKK